MECNYEIKEGAVLQDNETHILYPILKIVDDENYGPTAMVLGDNLETKYIPLEDIAANYTVTNYNNIVKEELVNHPKHYTREDAMECIDEMVMLFGREETKVFCKLNAWKYRYRAAEKNGIEDLKKSDWYIQKYKELDMPY